MDSLAKAALEREEFDKLVIRTDFGDDEAWQAVLAACSVPLDEDEDDYESPTCPVDDPSLAGATAEQLKAAMEKLDPSVGVLFVADEETMRSPHYALLAVNVPRAKVASDEPDAEPAARFSQPFRITARQASNLHDNVTLANLDFEEFARVAARQPDGLYR